MLQPDKTDPDWPKRTDDVDMAWLPHDVHFVPVDWRKEDDVEDREAVVGVLGFDPAELDAALDVEVEPVTTLLLAGSDGNLPPPKPPKPVKPSIGVHRDWDALRVVVVGRSDNDVISEWVPSFEEGLHNEAGDPKATGKTKLQWKPDVQRRAMEQQDALANILQVENVEVVRPQLVPLETAMADPIGLCQAFYRDAFVVIGNKLIVGQLRSDPNKNMLGLEAWLSSLSGSEVHWLPPCSMERNPNWEADDRPFLDGSDVFNLGKDVLVTMSYLATSPAGYRWLADLLEPDGYDVWPAYLTQDWMHGDYVLFLVRQGLCVAHLAGFKDGILPSPITDWECIDITRKEAERYAANSLQVREDLVIMSEGTQRVVKELEKRGVNVVEVPFDGPCYWSGGVHCSTADVLREGPDGMARERSDPH